MGGAGLALVLALSGCGGGEGAGGADGRATTGAERMTSTAPPTASPEPREETSTGPTGDPEASPEASSTEEERQGGAGDERPIASRARLTGSGGRIAPRRLSVPPFIAVRLELRSEDGARYGLRVAGRQLRVGPGRPLDRATLEGLAPGRSYVARPLGAGNDVRIVASAEPE